MNLSVAHSQRSNKSAPARREARPQPETESNTRRILDALPAGVLVIDRDGRIADSNSTALDLLGAPLRGLRWLDVIARAFAAGMATDGPILIDGRAVSVATAPLGGGPGQVVLVQDTTEQRVMQELTHRHHRLSAIGEMIAALSHQIRTPLASTLLYLSQLETESIPPAVRRRCADKMRACLGHLDRLTRDMLTFASGGVLSAEVFAVDALIDGVRHAAAPLIERTRCRLDIIDDSRGATVQGNRDALLTALQNLLENAADACAGGDERAVDAAAGRGNLRLLVRRVEDRAGIAALEIVLTDDGPGIPPTIRDRVTEPFFTTKTGGTGLGLAVVRAVVQAHKGALWIDSEAGMGTTVGIRLPMAAAETGA